MADPYIIHLNWNRIKSFTDFNFSPFSLYRGTERNPDFSSETGKHVCPPKSSFWDLSCSRTSIRSKASSGTVKGKSNSSSQTGNQLFEIAFVFFLALSAGTPTIATCYINWSNAHDKYNILCVSLFQNPSHDQLKFITQNYTPWTWKNINPLNSEMQFVIEKKRKSQVNSPYWTMSTGAGWLVFQIWNIIRIVQLTFT